MEVSVHHMRDFSAEDVEQLLPGVCCPQQPGYQHRGSDLFTSQFAIGSLGTEFDPKTGFL